VSLAAQISPYRWCPCFCVFQFSENIFVKSLLDQKCRPDY